MLPELAPIAPPTPTVNWGLEWLKIVLPPILTGLMVLLGAWLAYKFANIGRKEEVLYKERFKGFEEVAAYAFRLKGIASEFKLHLFVTASIDRPHNFIKLVKMKSVIIYDAHEAKPSRTNLVLMQNATREAFDKLEDSHDALFYLLSGILHSEHEYSQGDVSARVKRDVNDIRDTLNSIEERAEEVVNLSFRDIDLPRR